ncbi:hypothetical protein CcI156_17100 [Frankia sp. CcI156]|nr:hypothetical protein CcI156_17100 [Frankia sp. CcI156]
MTGLSRAIIGTGSARSKHGHNPEYPRSRPGVGIDRKERTPMTAPHEPDRVDLLRTLLDGCFKVGVRHPADLASYPEARPMLDMLSPPHPGLSEHRRALAAHRMILTAV